MRLALLTVALLALAAGTALAGANALEGTWRVTVVPADPSQGRQFDDTLTFRGELFSSEALKARGFEPVVYESDTRGRGLAVTFTAQQTGPDKATAKWQGSATANALQGTLVMTTADGSSVSYTVQGERVAKP